MKVKRKVSSNLGRTQHRDADSHYSKIIKKIGKTRSCPFYGGKKYPQFSKKTHDLLNSKFLNPNVPVEEFDFAKKGSVWGLQAYCKICYKAYRRGRIELARKRWSKMNDDQIRQYYRKNVAPTMRCSVCHKNLDPKSFLISRSMEKGLHNECIDCVSAKSASVREQAWLSEGDWLSWKTAVINMRKEPLVECVGWPDSVLAGMCKKEANGKKMHADHKVPLRAGGINDAHNFQPLCKSCNSIKSDQLDIRLSTTEIRLLVGKIYKKQVREGESIPTIERRLKASLLNYLEDLEIKGDYFTLLKQKKKEVNGQWVIDHAYRKGKEWLARGGRIDIKE